MSNTPFLTVVMRNKDRILYSGNADAVSSYNDKGPFDVLAEHENFIALIKDKVIIHVTQKEEIETKIENGIIRVCDNKAYVYVNFKL
jgi:F0F1-type ATP synthase epsilon subunit